MGDRIPPTQPRYAPQPSATTPDRDGNGGTGGTPGRATRKKKKAPDRPDSEKPKDPKAPGSHVDIRALRIETPHDDDWELSSAFAPPNRAQAPPGPGTLLAL